MVVFTLFFFFRQKGMVLKLHMDTLTMTPPHTSLNITFSVAWGTCILWDKKIYLGLKSCRFYWTANVSLHSGIKIQWGHKRKQLYLLLYHHVTQTTDRKGSGNMWQDQFCTHLPNMLTVYTKYSKLLFYRISICIYCTQTVFLTHQAWPIYPDCDIPSLDSAGPIPSRNVSSPDWYPSASSRDIHLESGLVLARSI